MQRDRRWPWPWAAVALGALLAGRPLGVEAVEEGACAEWGAGPAEGCGPGGRGGGGGEAEVGLLQLRTRRTDPGSRGVDRLSSEAAEGELQSWGREARHQEGSNVAKWAWGELRSWGREVGAKEAAEKLGRALRRGLEAWRSPGLLVGIIIGALSAALVAICCRCRGSSSASHGKQATPPHLLDQVLELLWPEIHSFLVEQVAEQLQPAIERALPPSLKGQLAIDADGLHFGDKPLHFENATTAKEQHRSDCGTVERITIYVDFVWDSECKLGLTFRGASLTVHDVSIRGALALEMTGSMPAPPFFSGVSAYMMNKPEVQLELTGDATGLRVLKRSVAGAVGDAVSRALVLPNRLGVRLAPGAGTSETGTPSPEGILKLVVHNAEGLQAADVYWLDASSLAPYFVLRCGTEEFRSEAKCKTRSPVYDQSWQVPIHDVAHQRIDISFFDEEAVAEDDFLGSARLSVAELLLWAGGARTMPLADEKGSVGRNGSVCLSAEFQRLAPDS